MKARIALISMLFWAGGCAEPCWFGQGKTLEQAIQDCRECAYDVNKATASVDSGIAAGMRSSMLMDGCMELRGYGRYRKNSLPAGLRTARVTTGYMTADTVAGK